MIAPAPNAAGRPFAHALACLMAPRAHPATPGTWCCCATRSKLVRAQKAVEEEKAAYVAERDRKASASNSKGKKGKHKG